RSSARLPPFPTRRSSDLFGSILEVLDVIVGVERREPHDPAVAALHPPHPVDRVGVDAAHRRIEHDPAEHFQALDVLAGEPGSIRSGEHTTDLPSLAYLVC